MIRPISRHWWLALLGMIWLGMSASAHAQHGPSVRVSNMRFNINVEVSKTPSVPPPTAPWYAYFPADARMMPPMNASPYPSWPMQFPPVPRPVERRFSSTNVAPTPMFTQQWPNYYTNGSNVQPVGFMPAQAPSYWYQGR